MKAAGITCATLIIWWGTGRPWPVAMVDTAITMAAAVGVLYLGCTMYDQYRTWRKWR
jgi:hypothetical protein